MHNEAKQTESSECGAEKVYRKTMKGREAAHAPQSFELLEGLQQSIFKGQVGAGRASQVAQ